MNKQELIRKYENACFGTVLVDEVLENLKQLDEPKPVKVKQFVADFIAEQKKLGHTLSYSIDASMSDRVAEWYWDNSELFVLAWIFGCEVEEEKRYYVKITAAEQYLVRVEDENFLGFLQSRLRSKFTRKELEEAGFGEVFNSPLFEVLEVE